MKIIATRMKVSLKGGEEAAGDYHVMIVALSDAKNSRGSR